jgi:3-hydroxyacyl-CoA dehydrogenase
VNVGVLGLGHLGNVMAARVTSNGHDVWWRDVMPSKVDEIWAVARWQRQMWPTQPDRGLVHATVDGCAGQDRQRRATPGRQLDAFGTTDTWEGTCR